MKNILFKNFGTFTNTENGEQYEINQVVIFKDNQEKIIANYFLDNFKESYQFEYFGEVKRKLKKDLTANYNFVVKSESQSSWNDKTQYILYINGDLNKYNFVGLNLYGEQLVLEYMLNGAKCSHCIGWNQKESNQAKYKEFEEAYKKINYYTLDNANMEKYIKDLKKAYNHYKKAKEIEKTYTATDYKKMSLSSGTTEEENKKMLKNNGFNI